MRCSRVHYIEFRLYCSVRLPINFEHLGILVFIDACILSVLRCCCYGRGSIPWSHAARQNARSVATVWLAVMFWDVEVCRAKFKWQVFSCTMQMFCHFDDYNWDWSLYRVSMMCLSAPIQAMVVKSTRIFHTGEWYVFSRLLLRQ